VFIVWHLCSLPNLVQISVIFTEIDAYMLEMGKNPHLLGSVLFGCYKYQGSVRFGFLSIF